MIKAYSKRQLHPYAGQAQIAVAGRARAITLDGANWEIQFARGVNSGHIPDGQGIQPSYTRATYLTQAELAQIAQQAAGEGQEIDERIVELAVFLAATDLPFPSADRFEYWLLDPEDEYPLALMFSCTTPEDMNLFPAQPEWAALPAAVMAIDLTDDEKQRGDSPVNYQVERLVAGRAGARPKAQWFERRDGDQARFPPLLLREDWRDPAQQALCKRYLHRQSTRLLMLHGLPHEDRKRLEIAARSYIFEVERFCALYPEVADKELLTTIRIEARLRRSADNEHPLAHRRDGVLYI